MLGVAYMGDRIGGGICSAKRKPKPQPKSDDSSSAAIQSGGDKSQWWNVRLHREILHRNLFTGHLKPGQIKKYVDASMDFPLNLTQLVSVTAAAQAKDTKQGKFYLEFRDGTEYKCKVENFDEFDVWLELFRIFTEFHVQLPHAGIRYTYKAYPIPSAYKSVLMDCFAFIQEHGKGEEGIFRAGNTDAKILKKVILQGGLGDLKDNFTVSEILGVAFIAKSILRSLPETLLTNYLLPHFMEAASTRSLPDLITAVRDLPQDNREVLQSLLETCVCCCLQPSSKMSVESLAKVVGPNFLDTENPESLIAIKTGDIPLIPLFEMFMYNMREIFGPKAIWMTKKQNRNHMPAIKAGKEAIGALQASGAHPVQPASPGPVDDEEEKDEEKRERAKSSAARGSSTAPAAEEKKAEKKEETKEGKKEADQAAAAVAAKAKEVEEEKKRKEQEKEREKERERELEAQKAKEAEAEKEKEKERLKQLEAEKQKKEAEEKKKQEEAAAAAAEAERAKKEAEAKAAAEEAEKEKQKELEKIKEKEREAEAATAAAAAVESEPKGAADDSERPTHRKAMSSGTLALEADLAEADEEARAAALSLAGVDE